MQRALVTVLTFGVAVGVAAAIHFASFGYVTWDEALLGTVLWILVAGRTAE